MSAPSFNSFSKIIVDFLSDNESADLFEMYSNYGSLVYEIADAIETLEYLGFGILKEGKFFRSKNFEHAAIIHRHRISNRTTDWKQSQLA